MLTVNPGFQNCMRADDQKLHILLQWPNNIHSYIRAIYRLVSSLTKLACKKLFYVKAR